MQNSIPELIRDLYEIFDIGSANFYCSSKICSEAQSILILNQTEDWHFIHIGNEYDESQGLNLRPFAKWKLCLCGLRDSGLTDGPLKTFRVASLSHKRVVSRYSSTDGVFQVFVIRERTFNVPTLWDLCAPMIHPNNVSRLAPYLQKKLQVGQRDVNFSVDYHIFDEPLDEEKFVYLCTCMPDPESKDFHKECPFTSLLRRGPIHVSKI